MTRLPHRPALTVVWLAVLLGACRGASPSAVPGPPGSAPGGGTAAVLKPATAAPTLAAGNDAAKARVLAAMRAQLAQPAYRVVQTSIAGGNTAQRTLEYIAPDRLRVVEEQVDGTTETIVIGGAGWKRINGNWQPDAFVARGLKGALDTMGDPAVVDDLAGKIGAVTDEGAFELNGAATHVYRYETVTGVQGNPITSTTRLWVRDGDGLPMKQEVIGTVGDTETTIVQVFTYDPAMRIEAPMK